MDSEDPFTSVNWDRGESNKQDSSINEETGNTELDSDQRSQITEEENEAAAKYETSFNKAEKPLDSSTLRLESFRETKDPEQETIKPEGTTRAAANWQSHEENSHTEYGNNSRETSQGFDQNQKVSGGDNADLRSSAHSDLASANSTSSKDVSTVLNMKEVHVNERHAQGSTHQPASLDGIGPNESEQQSSNPSLLAKYVSTQEIQGQKQMEDAFKQYLIDLHVTNPISDRDGNSKPFISYLITTETNHPEVLRLLGVGEVSSSTTKLLEKHFVKVRRRYGDFRFLHDCLISDFPQLLVPPLPPKLNFKYLTGDTFSTAFVHKRLHSLDRFVTFICQHKLLLQLSVFHYFISDSTEWSTFTKNLKILKGEDGDSLIVGKVVNEDLLTETIMNFFTASKHKKETNREILEISDKLKKLYENLVKLEQIFSKLNKKNTDLKNDYELFLNQINKLAALHEHTSLSENGPQDAGTSFTSSIDDTQLSTTSNFKIFSESLLYFLENWASLGRYIDESFLVSLKDCAKYIARLSSLIELHHNKKIDLQVLEDYLVKAKNDFMSVGGSVGQGDNLHRAPPPNPALIGQNSGGIVNNTTQLIKDTLSTSATAHIGSSQTEGKKQRLQQKIHHLEAEISSQTQLVDSLRSRIIDEEYPNWDRFNKIQLKKSMSELCDQEISFYKGLVDNWTDVEAKLVKRLEDLN